MNATALKQKSCVQMVSSTMGTNWVNGGGYFGPNLPNCQMGLEMELKLITSLIQRQKRGKCGILHGKERKNAWKGREKLRKEEGKNCVEKKGKIVWKEETYVKIKITKQNDFFGQN